MKELWVLYEVDDVKFETYEYVEKLSEDEIDSIRRRVQGTYPDYKVVILNFKLLED